MQTSATSVWETETAWQLTEVLAAISDVETMQNFLCDVMTEKEIIEISSRLEAAKMLQAGKKYTEIIEKTKLSSRTIARISDWMQNGQSGYEAALKVVNAHHSHISPVRAE
jgi:TrpR-related protein YerC/YecD